MGGRSNHTKATKEIQFNSLASFQISVTVKKTSTTHTPYQGLVFALG